MSPKEGDYAKQHPPLVKGVRVYETQDYQTSRQGEQGQGAPKTIRKGK